jgi:ABC-type transport system involved in cytochrome bd biosynthesis fused ATPase/permease subunit
MNVLSGRTSYQDGVLSINGDPITQYSMKRLMTKIAYVKQVGLRFFGSLKGREACLSRIPFWR